jgi:hypothetical protein
VIGEEEGPARRSGGGDEEEDRMGCLLTNMSKSDNMSLFCNIRFCIVYQITLVCAHIKQNPLLQYHFCFLIESRMHLVNPI